MKGADRIILVALPLVLLAAGFWFLVIGPKRAEVSDLNAEAESLRTAVAALESEVATAEDARASFPRDYANLVSLGAAVPEDGDQATLLHDLSELARRDSVSLRSLVLVPASDSAAPATTAPAEPTEPSEPSTPPAEDETATVSATATEPVAAALPLGAAVGPAGLPVIPYDIKYFGRFFDMADLLAGLDSRVKVDEEGTGPQVTGRLVTVDGFSMSADPIKGFPRVQTELSLTTYVVPAEQGIAAGATPAGPSAEVPVSTTQPATPAASTTAAVTP